jgi:hypothetical protein
MGRNKIYAGWNGTGVDKMEYQGFYKATNKLKLRGKVRGCDEREKSSILHRK